MNLQINNWEIIPNIGVGLFHIHDHWNKVVEFMEQHSIAYSFIENRVFYSIKTDNMLIAFDKEKRIFAITVNNCFTGKINNSVGIGSTLSDVKKELGEYKDGFNELYPTYELVSLGGVEFKLSDDDVYDSIDENEWNEDRVPIAAITVWDEKSWSQQVEQQV